MCSTSLQEAVSSLALIDFVLNILILLPVGYLIFEKSNVEWDEFQQDAIFVLVLWFTVAICVLQIPLALYLPRAANKRDDHGLKIWIKITVTLMVLTSTEIFLVALIAAMRNRSPFWETGGYYGKDSSIAAAIQFGGLCVKFYEVYVVHSLRKELYQEEMCLNADPSA